MKARAPWQDAEFAMNTLISWRSFGLGLWCAAFVLPLGRRHLPGRSVWLVSGQDRFYCQRGYGESCYYWGWMRRVNCGDLLCSGELESSGYYRADARGIAYYNGYG